MYGCRSTFPSSASLRILHRAAARSPPGTQAPYGDVAVLGIVDEALPASAGPARLADAETFRDAKAAVFGYPADENRPNGIWAELRLSSAAGGGILQSTPAPNPRSAPTLAFSGLPL